jgi:PAS domain S-box-containing protein
MHRIFKGDTKTFGQLIRRLLSSRSRASSDASSDISPRVNSGSCQTQSQSSAQLNGSESAIDRVQTHLDIQESEQKFHAIFEQTAVGITLTDCQSGRYLQVNQRFCQLLGYTEAELLQRTWQEMTHPDDLNTDLKYDPALWAGEIPNFAVEKRYCCKDGSFRWVNLTVSLIRDSTGIPKYAMGIVEDIQHRRHTEAILRQQTQREQALNRVIQALRNSLDLTTIFSTAVAEIGTLLNADLAGIMRYLPERMLWLNVASYRSSLDLPDPTGLQVPDDSNILTPRLKRLEIIQLEDAGAAFEESGDRINQAVAQTFPGTWLVIPLNIGTLLWGSLTLIRSHNPMPWQASEVELARVVSDQLAIAIQQSELYQQVQQLNADLERQVQQRTDELQQLLNFEALLKRITDKVRDSLDESQILQAAVRELGEGLGINCCDAGLYSADQTTTTIVHEYIRSVSPAQGMVFAIHESNYAWNVYQQLFQEQYCQFCFVLPGHHRAQDGMKAVLACPIFDDQGILGDLWLFKPQQQSFSLLEIRLVQQVANQCAIAVRQSRLHQAAQAQVEELEHLNRLKDDFLSTVSHELRSPMSNIKLATEMLEALLFGNDTVQHWNGAIHSTPVAVNPASFQKLVRYFQILKDESHREITLINDLLDLTRLDAGVEPLVISTMPLQIWIPHVAESLIERTQRQQQALQIQVPETLPPLTADFSYLERILTELLHNACKYTPAGGIITIAARGRMNELEIWVQNTGVEISAQDCDRIFEKFYRIPKNDPWKHGGTGLGLALVKKLAHCLGATIYAESSNNQVSFVIGFPRIHTN